MLFDRSHVWKSSSSARGAGLRGNYFVDLPAIDATPARERDFHTGRRCSRAQTQNCGSSLHTRSYDSPAWGPTEKVVRGPVSAGLRTRTPGVGENRRAVAAVAVARRRSIMVLGRAARSLVGSRRPACCPFSRYRGAAPGPAARRAWSSVDGVSGEMAAHQKLCFRESLWSVVVQTAAQFQRSRRRGGSLARTPRWTVARRNGEPRAASRPLRNRCRRVHAMRGTRNTQVQLIHKAPTTPAAAATARRRSPRAPAATPPRRCSVGTG